MYSQDCDIVMNTVLAKLCLFLANSRCLNVASDDTASNRITSANAIGFYVVFTLITVIAAISFVTICYKQLSGRDNTAQPNNTTFLTIPTESEIQEIMMLSLQTEAEPESSVAPPLYDSQPQITPIPTTYAYRDEAPPPYTETPTPSPPGSPMSDNTGPETNSHTVGQTVDIEPAPLSNQVPPAVDISPVAPASADGTDIDITAQTVVVTVTDTSDGDMSGNRLSTEENGRISSSIYIDADSENITTTADNARGNTVI